MIICALQLLVSLQRGGVVWWWFGIFYSIATYLRFCFHPCFCISIHFRLCYLLCNSSVRPKMHNTWTKLCKDLKLEIKVVFDTASASSGRTESCCWQNLRSLFKSASQKHGFQPSAIRIWHSRSFAKWFFQYPEVRFCPDQKQKLYQTRSRNSTKRFLNLVGHLRSDPFIKFPSLFKPRFIEFTFQTAGFWYTIRW